MVSKYALALLPLSLPRARREVVNLHVLICNREMEAPPFVKAEPEELEINNALAPENEDTAMDTHVKNEEDDIMAEVNVDAEFEAMERVQA